VVFFGGDDFVEFSAVRFALGLAPADATSVPGVVPTPISVDCVFVTLGDEATASPEFSRKSANGSSEFSALGFALESLMAGVFGSSEPLELSSVVVGDADATPGLELVPFWFEPVPRSSFFANLDSAAAPRFVTGLSERASICDRDVADTVAFTASGLDDDPFAGASTLTGSAAFDSGRA